MCCLTQREVSGGGFLLVGKKFFKDVIIPRVLLRINLLIVSAKWVCKIGLRREQKILLLFIFCVSLLGFGFSG